MRAHGVVDALPGTELPVERPDRPGEVPDLVELLRVGALRPSPEGLSSFSRWRACREREGSARAARAARGNSRATVLAPGRIAPYTCIDTPYLPRFINQYGVRNLSERVL